MVKKNISILQMRKHPKHKSMYYVQMHNVMNSNNNNNQTCKVKIQMCKECKSKLLKIRISLTDLVT